MLLNRRGWSPFLTCGSCGRAWSCPHCDVSLVLHERLRAGPGRRRRLGASLPPLRPRRARPGVVPRLRVGRPGAPWRRHRAPRDPARARPRRRSRCSGSTPTARRASGAISEILRRFDQAESGVLVGTQMVGKGHDFPDVVLSVVLDADATLRFPDFRAEERTFALVSQLAGRSGRGERWGQGARPDAGPRRSGDPPCGPPRRRRLPRRRARAAPGASLPALLPPGPDRARCAGGGSRPQRAAERLADALRTALPADAELLGPAPRFRRSGPPPPPAAAQGRRSRAGGRRGARGGGGAGGGSAPCGRWRSRSTSIPSDAPRLVAMSDAPDAATIHEPEQVSPEGPLGRPPARARRRRRASGGPRPWRRSARSATRC